MDGEDIIQKLLLGENIAKHLSFFTNGSLKKSFFLTNGSSKKRFFDQRIIKKAFFLPTDHQKVQWIFNGPYWPSFSWTNRPEYSLLQYIGAPSEISIGSTGSAGI